MVYFFYIKHIGNQIGLVIPTQQIQSMGFLTPKIEFLKNFTRKIDKAYTYILFLKQSLESLLTNMFFFQHMV